MSGVLPVVNPYPFSYEDFDYMETFRAKIEGRDRVPSSVTVVRSSYEMARRAAACEGDNALPNRLKKVLSENEEYRYCINQMPHYYQEPIIGIYKNRYSPDDSWEVNEAILRIDWALGSGQVVFHGGRWPLGHSPMQGDEFHTNRVLSTTLCPQVACLHIDYPSTQEEREEQSFVKSGALLPSNGWDRRPDGCLWVLEVKKGSSINSYFYKISGRGHLKHEMEVLLQAGLRIKCLAVESPPGRTIAFCTVET